MREPITDAELEQWATVRADDAGHLARELITYRRHAGLVTAIAERRRQIETEGWTPEHDDMHSAGEMAWAAVCYLQNAAVAAKMQGLGFLTVEQCLERATSLPLPQIWPWDPAWWKPSGQRRDLIKACALIIAEIERIDRASLDAGDTDTKGGE